MRAIKFLSMTSLACAIAGASMMSAQAQDFDPLVTKVLEASKKQDVSGWAFKQVMRIKALDEADVEIISTFDPSKKEDEQLELISVTVNGEREDEDGDEIDHSDMEIPSYADLDELLEGGVELLEEDSETAHYRIFPNHDGQEFDFGSFDIDVDMVDEDLIGEMIIQKGETPYVSGLRFFLEEPQGSVWIAKVKQLEFGFDFEPHESGAILARDFHLNLNMKTLLFLSIKVDIDAEYSEFEYVGQYQE